MGNGIGNLANWLSQRRATQANTAMAANQQDFSREQDDRNFEQAQHGWARDDAWRQAARDDQRQTQAISLASMLDNSERAERELLERQEQMRQKMLLEAALRAASHKYKLKEQESQGAINRQRDLERPRAEPRSGPQDKTPDRMIRAWSQHKQTIISSMAEASRADADLKQTLISPQEHENRMARARNSMTEATRQAEALASDFRAKFGYDIQKKSVASDNKDSGDRPAPAPGTGAAGQMPDKPASRIRPR